MRRESIDNLARRLAASLPKGLQSVRADIEENFRAVLKNGLARMDLVTREEFDVQQAVLLRSREKLEALEERLTELESVPSTAKPAARKSAASKNTTKKKTARKKTTQKKKPPPKD